MTNNVSYRQWAPWAKGAVGHDAGGGTVFSLTLAVNGHMHGVTIGLDETTHEIPPATMAEALRALADKVAKSPPIPLPKPGTAA